MDGSVSAHPLALLRAWYLADARVTDLFPAARIGTVVPADMTAPYLFLRMLPGTPLAGGAAVIANVQVEAVVKDPVDGKSPDLVSYQYADAARAVIVEARNVAGVGASWSCARLVEWPVPLVDPSREAYVLHRCAFRAELTIHHRN